MIENLNSLLKALCALGVATSVAALAGTAVPRQSAQRNAPVSGALYTQSDEAQNSVYAFARLSNGALRLIAVYPTQGQGLSGEHASQGSLALSPDKRFLYVTNFGSNDITAFAVATSGRLKFIGRYPSGGVLPFSVTTYGNWLYALNVHNPAGIVGFQINPDGSLAPLGSAQPLSGNNTRPLQVGFNNDGSVIVVTENTAENVDTFTVNPDGSANPAQFNPSAGLGPFGFSFDSAGHLLVSEAKSSSVSSYSLSDSGGLSVISGEVRDFGKAACWMAVTSFSGDVPQFAYTTNTSSSTLSGYSVAVDGTLSLLNPSNGIAFRFPAGSFPLDEWIEPSNTYLYVLAEHLGEIYALQIHSDGSITERGVAKGVPTTSYGIAAF